MTHEEMIRMMQNGFNNQRSSTAHIPIEKIDEFIDRVLAEKDQTLYSMTQALQWKLQAAPICSFPELEVYPQVLVRLKQGLEGGSK
jgi:hypothetical protein